MRSDFLDIFYDPLKDANVLEALKESISKNEDGIFDLNRQQLDRGLDAIGKDLGKYARFSYKNRWRPIDLKLTGKLRNEMSLQIDDKQTEIFSQDEKYDKIVKRWKNAFGVPAPLIDNMQDLIREDFVNEYKKELL